jgi:hypothetical protein
LLGQTFRQRRTCAITAAPTTKGGRDMYIGGGVLTLIIIIILLIWLL